MGAAQTAATSLGRQIVAFNASTESELDAAFARIVQQRIGTLLGASDPFLFNRRDQIVSLAARHGIPAIYYLRDFALAGGLMAYGNSLTDMYRLVGVYVGRILKGEKPTDLPVVQSTKFEFVINLQTATHQSDVTDPSATSAPHFCCDARCGILRSTTTAGGQ